MRIEHSGLRLAGEPLPPPPGPILLATGFRPFFLLAALWGALAMPLWLLLLTRGGTTPLPGAAWHGHESLVGYTGAVLAGFLLTAARHWSGGRPTAANGALGALVALWALGRIVHLPGVPGGWWTALPDAGWLLGVAVAIGRPLFAARSRRNYGLALAMGVLAALSVLSHSPAWASWALRTALAVEVAILAVVSGRIVPLFTGNARAHADVRRASLEQAVGPACVLLAVLVALPTPPVLRTLVGLWAGGLLLARMGGWRTASTLDEPLLWVLHAGCAWLGFGVLLQAVAELLPGLVTVGRHAVTVGALGTLTLGMMARVSLGHTGRPLRAAPLATVGFALMIAAGLARVAAALVPDVHLLWAAAGLWSSALLLWLVNALPALTTPRPDGKAG